MRERERNIHIEKELVAYGNLDGRITCKTAARTALEHAALVRI